MKNILKIGIIAIFLATLPSCKNAKGIAVDVVAYNNPISSIAQHLIKDTDITVELLSKKGGCMHDYTLTAKEKAKVENASLVLLDNASSNVGIDIPIYTGDEVTSILIDGKYAVAGKKEQDEHGWLMPFEIIRYADNISKALIETYPESEEKITKNLASFKEEIAPYTMPVVFSISPLSTHAGLSKLVGYAHTLHQEAEEESALSPKRIQAEIDIAKEEGVKYVLVDKDFSNPPILKTIKKEFPNIKIIELSTITKSGEDIIKEYKNNYEKLKKLSENER